jgi:hypothetical protein
MPRPSTALPTAHMVLRILIALNWIYAAVVLAILVGLFSAEHWTMMALGFPAAASSGSLVIGMRAIAALGLLAVPLNLAVLARLMAMVRTVRSGDPFVAANAYRLQAIAWFLLGQQLLSVIIGLIGKAVSTPAHPLHLDGSDSDLCPGARLRRRHADAPRPRRDGVTWPSPSSSMTCSTPGE